MSVIRKYMVEAAVFGCGAVVMVYEIVGSRVIAPYIGTSTYTWTSLIGVILAALSLGYWLGGKWADRNAKVTVLAAVIFFAGGMVAVTVLVKEPVLSVLSSASMPIEAASVAAAILLFAPASVLLGIVAPYAVRLSVEDIEHTGRTVGRLYALSTIGSITGTFLAGFVLIPFVGTNRTLYILAASLFSISVAIAPLAAERAKVALLVIFVLGIAFNEGYSLLLNATINYHDIDTEYNRVRIFDTVKNGRPLRAMSIDPYIYQSSIYLDTGESGASYMRYFGLASHFNPGFERSLIIGGAGYGFPQKYLKDYPNSTIEVVEIDPGMTKLAKKHFNLRDDPRLKSIHLDGRVFLNKGKSKTYDVVFIDAFNSLFSIPFQMTTIEAVVEIRRVLKEDGVVVVNIGSPVTGDGSRFLAAEEATYGTVFKNVRLFKVNPDKPDGMIQNVILIASEEPLPLRSSDQEMDEMLQTAVRGPRPESRILTDDLAPVEQMISIAQSRYSGAR